MATIPNTVATALKLLLEAAIDRAILNKRPETVNVSFANVEKTVTLGMTVEITDTLT